METRIRPIWKSCFTVTASNKDKPPKRREIWPVPRKCTKKVLAVSNKDYQSNAYYSLGAMLYGNGAKILQAATPIATSEPDKYNAEKAKADKDFKQAKEYLTKAVELDPKDENSKKILASINDILK